MTDSYTELKDWLATLQAPQLREIILSTIDHSPKVFDWLLSLKSIDQQDRAGQMELVNSVMKPGQIHYGYYETDEYATDCSGVVDMLSAEAQAGGSELLPIIERAITLMTRTI